MKNLFIETYNQHIKREGADRLLEWLEKSDFFTAPCSTRFHLCREGGLVEHSLGVFDRLKKNADNEKTDFAVETLAVCALLHDICKANYYITEMRNKKDEHGRWIQVPFYTVEDQLPYRHGEKSVYITSSFIKLSREEAMAIRWHMGGFDDSVKGGSYALGTAFEKYPLALHLHIADMQATYLDEKDDGKN